MDLYTKEFKQRDIKTIKPYDLRSLDDNIY